MAFDNEVNSYNNWGSGRRKKLILVFYTEKLPLHTKIYTNGNNESDSIILTTVAKNQLKCDSIAGSREMCYRVYCLKRSASDVRSGEKLGEKANHTYLTKKKNKLFGKNILFRKHWRKNNQFWSFNYNENSMISKNQFKNTFISSTTN